MKALSILLLSALASCSGLSHRLDARVPAPHSIAVLPVEGSASLAERELLRGLLVARLRERGYSVAESQHVDRLLSETGRMADPETFCADRETIPAVAAVVGVDALLHVTSFDETNWNAIALRRHSIAASLRIVTRQGAEWWSARHSVAETGGFLLKSGQVVAELLAQGVSGTSAASLGKIDTLVDEVASVLPQDPDRSEHEAESGAPSAREGSLAFSEKVAGRVRTTIGVRCEPGMLLVVDVGPLQGLPMAGVGDAYRAAVDLPEPASRVVVRSRNAMGAEASSMIGGGQ